MADRPDEEVPVAPLPDDGADHDADEGPGDFVYDEDADNLVFDFDKHPLGKEAKKKIAAKVREDFDTDVEGRTEYTTRVADDWKLFCGELPRKDMHFEKAATLNVPILFENTLRIMSHLKNELFGDLSEVVRVIPVNEQGAEEAEVMSLHDNWQIREAIPDFIRQQDRGLLMFLVPGDVTCDSYYDEELRQNRHEMLTVDEFVTPYVFVSTMPDYSDVPHYTRVRFMYEHQLEDKAKEWAGVQEILDSENEPAHEDEPTQTMRIKIAKHQGQDSPSVGGGPHKVLQYDGWFPPKFLPGQTRSRFCRVMYHYDTETVLSLRIHEMEDWRDRARFDRQMQEAQQFKMASDQHAQMTEQHGMATQQHAAHKAEYHTALAEMMEAATASGKHPDDALVMAPPPPEEPPPLPPAPLPPGWMQGAPDGQPEPVRMVPIHMYAHGVCIENLVGTTGLGYGRGEADMNRSANTAANQVADAATLNNSWSLLITDEVAGAIGDKPIKIAPGRVNVVRGVTGEALKSGIMELKPAPANAQLMGIVEKNYEWGQSSMAAEDILSGAPGKSGETARGQQGRLDQAVKQLSGMARTYSLFFKQIMRHNAKLNEMFLDEEQLIQVTYRGQPRQIKPTRDMYRRNYNVELRSDLKFKSSTQKIEEAVQLVQLPSVMPPLQANLPFLQAATRKLLEARGDYDMLPLLGPPLPPPQTPMGVPPPPPPGMVPPGAPGAGPPGSTPGGPGGGPPRPPKPPQPPQ